MRHIFFFLLAFIMIACHDNPVKKYGFYSKENYYFDTLDDGSHYVDSSDFSKAYFATFDEPDFPYSNDGEIHILYIKSFTFEPFHLLFSIKSIDSGNINIISMAKVDFKYFKNTFPPLGLRRKFSNYRIAKKIRNIDYDTVMLVKQRADLLKKSIHKSKPRHYGDEDDNTLFYFDGSKYYIINSDFVGSNLLKSFNDFLLDTTLNLDTRFGIQK